MRASTAHRLAHGLWLATALFWVGSLVLILIDQPSGAINWLLLAVPTATYATVGALVARRRSENPIGWLFCAVALSLIVWLFALAYAQAGRGGVAGISSLPGATAATWIGVLSPFVVLPVVLPIFLLFFPDGHLRSRRWRFALVVVTLGGALLVLGAIGQIHQYAGTTPLVPPPWVDRIPGIDAFFGVGLALTVGAAFAGLISLVLRFRSATAEERQSLRLLVVMIMAMAVATVVALVTVLGSGGADWSWIPVVLAFLVVGFGVLIGIPLATAAAVLTYGLYDVGVVVKKTVVYVLLVIFFVILLGLLSLMLSPLAFIGTDEGGDAAGRDLIVVRIVAGAAVFALVLTLTFRPAKRLAKRLVYGRRATPYEAMAEFSERLGEAYSTQDVLPRMAEIVRASTGADVARVWLHVGGQLRPVAAAPSSAPAPAAIDCGQDELPDIDGLRTFPVRDRAELLGAITLAMPAAESLSKNGEQLVTDVSSQAGLVLRNVRLIEELQESRRRIVTAQDERARKLERDIHDGAQQQLVALSVKLGLAEQLTARDPDKAIPLLAELRGEASEALENLRDLARGIYPPLLADKGLPAALEAQARKAPIPIAVEPDGVGRYAAEVEAAVYFCCLEALNNVGKYAEASGATVRIAGSNGNLTFAVSDDGGGFDTSSTPRGSGLLNMRDRIEALGGAIEVDSQLGRGTTISGRIPVPELA